MSINGDLTIYRNGKSKSQVSVYDYPEHLNPFYEDENHKRLRFWKLGRNKKGSGKESRRSSFTIDGFKEMWAFKSFRLKKKSSTLGINKTSESPPILRRDVVADTSQSNYGTYDPRMRHTTELSAFQRNVPYRNSLQDMRSSTPIKNGFGFNRNDDYRSTIQTPSRLSTSTATVNNLQRRYVYGGSQTPQPNRSNIPGYYDDSNHLSRGSSQLSMASSTNPFDDDDDVIVGEFEVNSNSADMKSSPMKRIRKKRRAPPPPIAVSKVIEEENLNNSTAPVTQKNKNTSQTETQIDLTNLTAEIETFVKTTSNETDSKSNGTNSLPVTLRIEEDSDVIKSDVKIVKESKDDSLIVKQTSEVNNNNQELHDKKLNVVKPEIKPKPRRPRTLELKSRHTNDQNIIISETDDQKISNIRKTSVTTCNDFPKNHREVVVSVEINHQTEPKENGIMFEKTIGSKSLNEVSSRTEDKISNLSLKITESKEDVSSLEDNSKKPEISPEIKTQVRYIPLKESSPQVTRDIHRPPSPPPPVPPLITKSNTIERFSETAEDLPPQRLERRRSVREIIASINRSQSLLKVNKDINNKSSDENNLNSPNCSDKYNYEIPNYKISSQNGMEPLNNLNTINNSENDNVDEDVKEVEREFAGIIEKLSNQLNNNDNNNVEIFKKCSPQRESSPTTSNLDWNPLPKPKRTKKLSPILNTSESNRESPIKFNERIIE